MNDKFLAEQVKENVMMTTTMARKGAEVYKSIKT